MSLTTNIRVHAQQLALHPNLQILRRARRPLLCGMEQARRSALAHHVHRTAPMGPRVLINGIWYKTFQAQLCKVMMVLLENGLLNNHLSAPYPELRESVKEDGLLDGNFNMVLKRNHELFKGAITKDSIKEGGAVELDGVGLTRLAEILKELGQ